MSGVKRPLRAIAELAPPAGEVALAVAVGGLVIAATSALAALAMAPWPAGGWSVRLQHHLWSVVTILGVSAWLAAPALVAHHLGRRAARQGGRSWIRWAGWIAMAGCASAAMAWILGPRLMRQALVLCEGGGAQPIYATLVALCGAAVPAALLVGAVFASRGAWITTPLALAAGVVVAGHAALGKGHPGVHAALLWISSCLIGGALARRYHAWLTRGRRAHALGAILGAAGAAAALLSPPNAVRIELFRRPGAGGAWVLARLAWRLPDPESSAPSPRPWSPPPARRLAMKGLPPDPVVVLITIDALRADVLLDRANDGLLPVLSRIRDSGAFFPRAVAPGTQTTTSLTSVFTGRYFSQLYWQPYGQGSARFPYPAADSTPRFPGLLSRAGVRTASFQGLLFLSRRFGITRGFAEETVVATGRDHASARAVMTPLLARLERADSGPHFVFAHLMDPHSPYDRGRLTRGSPRARYLSEIEVVDRWLGKLTALMRRRFPDRGYLIVSSDHGEAFGEHGTRFHSTSLYDELLRVPLVIRGPKILARRIAEPVGLIDLGPTVLELFGQPRPAASMGESLVPLALGSRRRPSRPLLAEGRLRRALITRGGLKVIEDTVRKTVEVYDLTVDPAETRNLFDLDRRRCGPAVAALRAFYRTHALRKPGYEPPLR